MITENLTQVKINGKQYRCVGRKSSESYKADLYVYDDMGLLIEVVTLPCYWPYRELIQQNGKIYDNFI